MTRAKKITVTVSVLLVLGSALIGAGRGSDIYFLIKKNFTIFSEVFREVSLNYVDEVDPEKLMRKGINSMLESLDPYTVLIDEAQNQDIEIITRGSYGGVGLDVGVRGDNIVIIAPIDGYVAQQKGLRPGDIILGVNGVSTEGLTPEEVQELTIGDPGTVVELTIRRYGVEQDLTFELERQQIEVKNIAYTDMLGEDGNIGYISLTRFSRNAAEEIRRAIESMQKEVALAGLVIDLRNNPGGLLEEAVRTVDKFVEPGLMVVETRGRLSEHNNAFHTEEPPLLKDLPLVVLQNEGSASASEIVAGALQDLDRAVIVGEQSFGKGLVQIVRPLSYNTALKITTSRYYIPSGRSIQSLTYNHDERNSVTTKPDSLRKAFKTRNGRVVYDGNGIKPDIAVSPPSPSLLETELLKESHFFLFANRFASRNSSFSKESISDRTYEEFRDYLNNEGFSYQTPSERHLSRFEKNIESNLNKEEIEQHLTAIRNAVDEQKREEFESQIEGLKHLLFLEIISRYEGNKGRTEASLRWDPVVEKALEVVHNENRYKQILAIR